MAVMTALVPTWALREAGSEASLVRVLFMGDCPWSRHPQKARQESGLRGGKA